MDILGANLSYKSLCLSVCQPISIYLFVYELIFLTPSPQFFRNRCQIPTSPIILKCFLLNCVLINLIGKLHHVACLLLRKIFHVSQGRHTYIFFSGRTTKVRLHPAPPPRASKSKLFSSFFLQLGNGLKWIEKADFFC